MSGYCAERECGDGTSAAELLEQRRCSRPERGEGGDQGFRVGAYLVRLVLW